MKRAQAAWDQAKRRPMPLNEGSGVASARVPSDIHVSFAEVLPCLSTVCYAPLASSWFYALVVGAKPLRGNGMCPQGPLLEFK